MINEFIERTQSRCIKWPTKAQEKFAKSGASAYSIGASGHYKKEKKQIDANHNDIITHNNR